MRKIKIKNVAVLSGNYNLFLFLLICPTWKSSLIIIDESNYRINTNVYKKIKNEVNDFYIFKRIEYKKNCLKYYIEKFKLLIFLTKKGYYFIQNLKIYGIDHEEYSFFKNKGYFILEDGLVNYLSFRKNNYQFIKNILKLNFPFYKPYGYSKKVRKIYLTGITKIPLQLKEKVEIIDIKKIWFEKTPKERSEILRIFEVPKKLREKKYILFTQPLSEDKLLTEEEKINLYKKIIEKYDLELLVIKPHPREQTDYLKIFSQITIMNMEIPAILLKLLNFKFKRAITIFSTAVFNLERDIEIDFYGTRVHPKLLEKWGDSDLIMKANAFLDEEE